jgi:hypothetical protein
MLELLGALAAKEQPSLCAALLTAEEVVPYMYHAVVTGGAAAPAGRGHGTDRGRCREKP